MAQVLDVVRGLCTWLWNEQAKAWNNRDGEPGQFYKTVSQQFKPFDSDYEIDILFRDAQQKGKDVDFGNRFIYLDALHNQPTYIPAVTLRYEQAGQKWAMALLLTNLMRRMQLMQAGSMACLFTLFLPPYRLLTCCLKQQKV